MTAYLIFEEHEREEADPVYTVIGQADVSDASAAIRTVATDSVEEGEVRRFWATPLRSWRGLEVKTKVVVDAKQLTFPEGDEVVDAEPEPEPEPVPQGEGGMDSQPDLKGATAGEEVAL